MRIHYCKSLKHTGKPIIVNMENGKEFTTNKISGIGHWKVEFNNAEKKEKRSGATTILEVKNEEDYGAFDILIRMESLFKRLDVEQRKNMIKRLEKLI